jgi:protein involved in polysaccharide export with SLBB domain
VGSYRDIRVIRGGQVVHLVDLYPLRADGLGNINFGFQNGDTLFVPLIKNQVQLEGGFTRVVATVQGQVLTPPLVKQTDTSLDLERRIRLVQAQLAALPAQQGGASSAMAATTPVESAVKPEAQATAQASIGRGALEETLADLQQQLLRAGSKDRADQRISELENGKPDELAGQPAWLSQWILEGKVPVMQFEMLPGETVKDALRFAGGFALKGFSGSVTLRRMTATGFMNVVEVPAGNAMDRCTLERGDVVTALPMRGFDEGAVSVRGWARIQGIFARKEGQRLGDFLKSLSLVLPDTYLERGELVRTQPDGSKRFLIFNVTKAMAGDAAHDFILENRDVIDLYRVGDLRQPLSLTVVGPVTRPGMFEFIPGMRASDLLFRAGVPLESADRYVAELAHTREGNTTEIQQLELAKLLSNVDNSPVDLKDDQINPKLKPFDQISIYSKPDYHQHWTITLSGQVVRPGSYDLENEQTSLRDVIKRAGGLTPEAMPNGGIFLRPMAGISAEKSRATALSGIEKSDPTANGINEILGRLNETKRMPVSGALEVSPVLHRLMAGSLNRLVVDIPGILAGDPSSEVYLMDGDEIIIPRKTEVAYVVGETASPFAAFKVNNGEKVKDLLSLAGGTTPNADTWHIRLLKANGRIIDSWVSSKVVEPGDAVLVPQKIRKDVTWQESLTALTPIAIMIEALRQ